MALLLNPRFEAPEAPLATPLPGPLRPPSPDLGRQLREAALPLRSLELENHRATPAPTVRTPMPPGWEKWYPGRCPRPCYLSCPCSLPREPAWVLGGTGGSGSALGNLGTVPAAAARASVAATPPAASNTQQLTPAPASQAPQALETCSLSQRGRDGLRLCGATVGAACCAQWLTGVP